MKILVTHFRYPKNLIFNSVLSLLLSGCAGGGSSSSNPELSANSMSISYPAEGQRVAGVVQISPQLTDTSEVATVEFYLSDSTAPFCVSSVSPFVCSFDTSSYPNGTLHSVRIVALKADGSVFQTAQVSFVSLQLWSNICKNSLGADTDIKTCLNSLYASNEVAGNINDYYLNEDNDHSSVNMANHPTLTKFYWDIYGYSGTNTLTADQMKAIRVDPMKVKVGNASIGFCAGGVCGGDMYSVLRYKMNMGMIFDLDSQKVFSHFANYLYEEQYLKNFFNWHVEHWDHDERDELWFMVPFMNLSQGSSWSEIDELDKFFYTLAAFKPATKQKLKETGSLMPTLQMIHRRSRVSSDQEYLSGIAHPNAFDDANNSYSMIRMANAMLADSIPPVVKMKVVEESFADFSGSQFINERRFTTPASIARVWGGADQTTPRRIVVSLEDSVDFNSRPLQFQWKLLRGDPSKVQIRLLNESGTSAEIIFQYHPEISVAIPGRSILSSLAIVGVFANNGTYYSAPAFITSSTGQGY